MGRRKETHTAKWIRNRQTTISDQGEVVLPLMSRGRPLELRETEEDIRLMMKSVEEARLRHAAEQLRREFSKREMDLMRRQWDLTRQLAERERSIQQLDQRNKELEVMIERVHDLVHPDRSDAVDLSEQAGLVAPPSNVTH